MFREDIGSKEHGDKGFELLIKKFKFRESSAVFIITPFTEIRFQLNGLLFKPIIQTVKLYLPQTTANDISNWLKTHVGTVHTFRGKQVMVLYCVSDLIIKLKAQLFGHQINLTY
jgi:hypothetical protein